jgi:hypothetical protein
MQARIGRDSRAQAAPLYGNLGKRLEAAREKQEALLKEQAHLLEKARQAAKDADRLCRELRGTCRNIAACDDIVTGTEEDKGTHECSP